MTSKVAQGYVDELNNECFEEIGHFAMKVVCEPTWNKGMSTNELKAFAKLSAGVRDVLALNEGGPFHFRKDGPFDDNVSDVVLDAELGWMKT